MIVRRNIVVAVIVTFCLAAALFVVIPVSPTSMWPYNPWWDLNDDGKIDISDLARVSGAFGTTGQNISKAGLLYDGGWINVTWEMGQNCTITHGLNLSCTDLIVDARGRTQAWNRTYGGTGYDFAYALVQTGDGGYAIAGCTYSFGAGSSDFWLVKTDASGNMQWEKTYGGTNEDGAYALVQTSDGGYAIAGYTDSFGVGNDDFWLVKTDSAGNEDFESGLAWVDSSADTITLCRGAADVYWNFVRVRLWKPRQTP